MFPKRSAVGEGLNQAFGRQTRSLNAMADDLVHECAFTPVSLKQLREKRAPVHERHLGFARLLRPRPPHVERTQRLHEAARVLSAGAVRRFVTIDLRLLVPGLAAAGGLVLLSVLKELPATLMLRPIGFNTLATRIFGTAEEALLLDAGRLSLVLIGLSGMLTWALVLRRSNR